MRTCFWLYIFMWITTCTYIPIFVQASFELRLCVQTSISREVNVYSLVWFWLWDPTVALLHYFTVFFRLLQMCNVEWSMKGWLRMMKDICMTVLVVLTRNLTEGMGKPSEFRTRGPVKSLTCISYLQCQSMPHKFCTFLCETGHHASSLK
jgi:hypothetical protein